MSTLSKTLASNRQSLQSQFFSDGSAEATRQALSRLSDRIIGQLLQDIPNTADVSIFAIGGYGRRELHPFSDLDLLILQWEESPESESAIKTLLHQLWDLNFSVGQQVWPVASLQSLDPLEHLEFFLALLDLRVLSDPLHLKSSVLETIQGLMGGNRELLLEAVVARSRARHQNFENTIYHLEPDLKIGPGGLRDWLTTSWVDRIRFQAGTQPPSQALREAYEFLSALRCGSHFAKGRPTEQLTAELQERLTSTLFANQFESASLLMQAYYRQARAIHRFCLRKLETASRPKDPSKRIGKTRPISTLKGVLEVFIERLKRGEKPGEDLRQIVETLHNLQIDPDEPLLDSLVELFQPRKGLYQTLSEIYDLGILETLFPEFQHIHALVIRNLAHRYTVDEHTLQAIRAIEQLTIEPPTMDGRLSELLENLEKPEIVNLALLFHDVGKGLPGDHCETSANLAVNSLARFGFSEETTQTVDFLIRNHLVMSNVVFRRDLTDPSVLSEFADLVGNVERLRHLCLLTFADISALAPDKLDEWKKDLLWQVYVRTYNQLTLDFGSERLEVQTQAPPQIELPSDIAPEAFRGFLSGFPKRYLSGTPQAKIYQHFRMASQLNQETPIQTRLNDIETHYELVVLAIDRPRLFARIVGLLSYYDMNILKGSGFSNQAGVTLDRFHFRDHQNRFALNPTEKESFLKQLHQAIVGELSVPKLLKGKEASPVFRPRMPSFPPTFHLEDVTGSWGEYSVLEIVAPDRVGLLYRVGTVIAELDCNIELLLLSTEGARAVDVFYLSHKGSKLTPPLKEQLETQLILRLDALYEISHGHRQTQQS